MNILEQEDLIKGLPDQALFQQADNPTGDIPQFLVISEIQRRTDMRKRFEAAEPQPQTTAAERIVSEGIGAAMAPQNSLPPPAMPAPPSNPVSQMDGSSPLMAQGMAAGGILGFSNGGGTSTIRDLATKMFGYTPISERTSQYYADQEQHNKLMGRVEEIEKNLMGSIRDKRARRQEALRIAREEQAAEAPVETPVDDPAFYEENPATAGYFPQEKEVISESYLESLPAGLVDNTSSVDKINEPAATALDFPTPGANLTAPGQATEERTVDSIEDFDPNSIKTQLPSPTDAYLNPELVAEVGETVTQGEALKGAQTTENELLQRVLDSFESRRAGAEERLGRRRTESQDLINEIREEGKRDALSAALIQLGAGISSGDMSSGLRDAGSAMTSANAVARDAARAEQRGMRDYEESVLGQVDQLGMEEAQFAFGAERDAQARAEEIRQWEATHGLARLNAKNDMIFKEAGLELQAAKLEDDAYIGREGLKNQITKMNNDLKISTDTSKREAMRTFTSVLDSIQDFIDELPAGTSAEEMEEIRNTQQARILSALRTSLGEEFYDAFMQDFKPVRGDDTEAAIDYTEL